MGFRVRELLRRKGSPYDELGLDDSKWTDDQLIDAMLANPILINRPITGAITGVGAAKKVSAVRWGVAGSIVIAWIITLPAAGFIGALFYALAKAVS
jgi:Phosphate transporter family/ArsC family